MSTTSLDRPMRVTSFRSWLLLGTVGVLLASVVVWSVVDTLPERIEGKGVLQTEAGTQQITAAGEGILSDLTLKAGDQVEAGQVIGTVRAASATEASRAAQARYDEARRSHTQLEQSENTIIGNLRVELQRKRALVAEKTAAHARQVDNLAKRIVTQATVDAAKSELDIARNEVTDYEMRIRSRQQSIASSRSGVEQARISLERTIGTAAEIAQIKSGVTGRITYLHRRPGDSVYSGQPIADVQSAASGTALEVVAYVAARNGKRVLPGQAVRLSVAGMPTAEFGYLQGEVKSVSDYPVSPELAQRMLKEATVTEASYEVKIRPIARPDAPGQYSWLAGPGRDEGVRAGTKVDVAVQVAERRPITLVLPLGRENRVPEAERSGTVKPGVPD
jgi:HlyD family secretion protein